MIRITSVNNPLVINLQKLKQKKHRYEQHRFIIEGYHLVEEAYQANCLEQVLAVDEKDFIYSNVSKHLVNEVVIKKLASTLNPQPIIGIAKMKEDSWKLYKRYLLLDDIQDPGNLGTMIRSAAALGIDAIVCSPNCVDTYNEKVIRATQGTLFKIALYRRSIEEVITEFKKALIPLVCTSLKNAEAIQTLEPMTSFALIIGSEAHGVKREILDQVSKKIYIPMKNQVESLNAGVAAGIVMYHLTR